MMTFPIVKFIISTYPVSQDSESLAMKIGKLELTALKDRGLRGDLIQMFKIMNKMDKCDRFNRFKIILNQVRAHCFKYFKKITRQPYRENFFYKRIVNI